MDISIKQVEKSKQKLYLQFKGKDVNDILVNTLRRIILEHIPVYAFDPKYIKIDKNTSIFNNDYMKLRISNFPITGIDNDVKTLDKLEYLEKKAAVSLATEKLDDITDNINELNMVVNIKATGNELNVTTKNAKFYINESNINNIYKNDLLICKLKDDQELQFTAIGKLGIAKMSDIWSAVSICVFEEISPSEFIFKLESSGQLEETEIIKRACIILKTKLNKLKEFINNYKFENKKKGILILDNENHTMGNLLTHGLQEHKNIEFAGYKMDHLLIDQIIIRYVTDGGKSISSIFDDVISKKIKIFDKIKDLLK